MYNHLTVALDGSHNAQPALIEAVRLAARGQARLTLVHVVSLHDFAVESVGLLDSVALQNEARSQGRLILDEALSYAQKMGVTQVNAVLLDAPEGGSTMTQLLVNHAEQAGSDLLVIGTHGRRGWRHLLMGSFAEEVLRKTTLPLLVVRNPEDDEQPAATAG